MTDDNPKQEAPGKYQSNKQAEGEANKAGQQTAATDAATSQDAADTQQKQLEPIRQLAEQLAQALTSRNAQAFTPQTIAAVEKYGEIARALIVSKEAAIVAPAPEQPGSEAPVSEANKPKKQNQAT